MKSIITALLLLTAFIITGCQSMPGKKLTPVYTVNFDAQGGAPVPGSMKMERGKTYALPYGLTMDGHSFRGWSETSGGTPVADPYGAVKSLTLYAVWQTAAPEQYVVTYDSAGGDYTPNPVTVDAGGTVGSLPRDPVRDNYTFGGWFYNNAQFTVSTPVNTNITVTARWTLETYTVTFNFDNGTPPFDLTYSYGARLSSQALPSPARTGHTFAGWYKDNAVLIDGTYIVTGAASITARWTPIDYTVTFNFDNGTPPFDLTYSYGARLSSQALPSPARTGHTFAGWYKDNATQIDNTYLVTGDTSITARWTVNTYTVTFDGRGGVPAPAPVDYTYGARFDAHTRPQPAKYAVANKAWAFDNGTDAADDYIITGNFTVYARYLNGAGTAASPFELGDKDELNFLRDNLTAAYILTADIALTSAWVPVGDDTAGPVAFSGTLDGDNYTISGLEVNVSDKGAGLFSYTAGAAVKNITVRTTAAGVNTTAANAGAGILTATSIDSVYTGVYTSGVVGGSGYTGGIAGLLSGGGISLSSSGADVMSQAEAGGLAGRMSAHNSAGAVIENSYSTGLVDGDTAGGIAGAVYDSSSVNAVYTYGAVAGDDAGGIAGKVDGGSVTNAVAVNREVLAVNSAGSVAGTDTGGTYAGNFAVLAMPVTGAGAGVSGTERTITDLMTRAFYAFVTAPAWKFGSDDANPWKITEGVGLPGLYREKAVTITFDANAGQYPGAALDRASAGYNRGDRLSLNAAVSTAPAYAVTGWNTAPDGSGRAYTNDEFIYDNLTLYARYAAVISTAQQLDDIRNNLSGKYVLTADIDLSAHNGGVWTPVAVFSGTLDGAGHTISGLTVNAAGDVGLFGILNGGTVKNLTVRTGPGGVTGSISGILAGTVQDDTLIENVHTAGLVTGRGIAGGITGMVNDCVIRSSSSSAAVNAPNASGGGIAGEVGSGVTVTGCYTAGSVTADFNAGGIAGSVLGGTVTGCYAAGFVTAGFNTGGIVGFMGSGVLEYNAALNLSVSGPATGRVAGGVAVGAAINNNFARKGMPAGTGADRNDGADFANPGAERIRAAYTGIGWHFGSYGDAPWMIDDNNGLPYHYWRPEVTVTYDANGGTGSVPDGSFITNSIFAAPDASSLSKNGRAAAGWNTSPDGTGIRADGGFYVHDNITLYARYEGEIATAEELDNMRANPAGDYILTRDIDLSGIANWAPVGTAITPFTGTLDGAGHTISGLAINTDGIAGLIYALSGATVKNLTIRTSDAGVVSTTAFEAGILAGYAISGANIVNVHTSGSVRSNTGSAGGILGTASGTDGHVYIKNSSSSADVSAAGSAGGITGRVFEMADITGCYTSGNVSGDTAGGILGDLNGPGTDVLVAGCYSASEVKGIHYAGGIVGRLYFNTPEFRGNVALNGYVDITGAVVGRGRIAGSGFGVSFTGGNYARFGMPAGAGAAIQDGTEFAGPGAELMEATYTGISWLFGATDAAPWMINEGSGLPHHYWRARVAVTFDNNSALYPGAELDKYGADYVTASKLSSQAAPVPVNGAYVVVGWNTKADGTGDDYAPDSFIFDNVTLYAQYAYPLGTAAELGGIRNNLSGKYVLTADIDLSGIANWAPVGNIADPFRGTLDGAGHTISGLTVNVAAGFAGLFGHINGATVKNLTVRTTDAGVESTNSSAGILMGSASGAVIENVHTSGRVTGGNRIGGIVGAMGGSSTINSSSSSASVTGQGNAGGIAGEVANGSTVTNSYATGAVTGTGAGSYAGGIAGLVLNSTITNSYATGAVTGTGAGSYAGGIAGNVFGSTVRHNAALNASASGTGWGRVAALFLGSIVTDNFAWDGMVGAFIQDVYNDGTGKSLALLMTKATYSGAPLSWPFDGSTPDSPWVHTDDGASLPHHYWRDNVTVTFVTGGGAGALDKDKAYYKPGEKLSKYAASPVAAGTSVAEWNTASDGSGKAYRPGDFVFDNITLYAVSWGRSISTPAELDGIRNDLSGRYVLTADIDLSGIANWSPVGDTSNPFTGILDGAGHTISGLTSAGTGLFGYINGATVKNLTVRTTDAGVVNTGTGSTGILAGWARNSVIENVHTSGRVYCTGFLYAGGIVGNADGGTVICSSSSSASVTSQSLTGGIAGNMSDSTVTNSYATGAVTGSLAGGIAGSVSGSGSITNSYATGAVTGTGANSYAGGIAGYVDVGTVRYNAALNASVSGTNRGRVAGESYGTINNNYARNGMPAGGGGNDGTDFDAAGDELKKATYTTAYTPPWPFGDAVASPWVIGGAGLGLPHFYWRPMVTVTYDGMGATGGTLPASQTVSTMSKFVSPDTSALVKGTAAFDSWYTIVGGSAVNVDANTYIHDNITLYAKYAGDIVSAADLAVLPTGAAGTGKTYTLTRDIDLSGTANWAPVNDFRGTLDGAGHTISGLTVNASSGYAGLFGILSGGATVKNLTVRTSDAGVVNTGGGDTGILAGWALNSVIENVHTSGSVTGNRRTGGIVGSMSDSTVSSSSSSASVTSVVSGTHAGGIAGVVMDGSAIRDSYTTGTVSSDTAGGIAGVVESVGIPNLFIVERCYATGAVTGTFSAGGIVGLANPNSTVRQNAAINASVASGSTSRGRVVGIVGGNVTANFAWDGVVGAFIQDVGHDGMGKSLALLMTRATYSDAPLNWPFDGGTPDSPWVIGGDGLGLPHHYWRDNVTVTFVTGGGAGALDKDKAYYKPGEKLSKYAAAPVAAGTSVAEWNTASDGSGKMYRPGDFVFDNVTLYAVSWGRSVSTPTQLADIRNNLSGRYVLTADIDLSGISNWAPVGDGVNQFTGILDGAGHTISGLTVDVSSGSAGLFGYINGATVKNLTVRTSDAGVVNTGTGNTGILAGTASGAVIENVHTSGRVYCTGDSYAGGIVGYADGGTIIRSSSSSASVTSRSLAGGIAGYVNNGTITNSYATGAVTSGSTGGIAGVVENLGVVERCYATGAVTGISSAGGIAGRVMGGTVTNSYATGAVTCDEAGGIAGSVSGGTVRYNAALNASVSGTNWGRVVGKNSGSAVDNNYARAGMPLGAGVLKNDGDEFAAAGDELKKATYTATYTLRWPFGDAVASPWAIGGDGLGLPHFYWRPYVTITYDLRGGTGGRVPAKQGAAAASKFIPPYTTGLTGFTGWNTKADGTGDTVNTGTFIFDDITLYAQY